MIVWTIGLTIAVIILFVKLRQLEQDSGTIKDLYETDETEI